MSIRLMTDVLDTSPLDGTALLIHLLLADMANDEGVCWPLQSTIAKRARCSDRYVRDVILKLEQAGLLERSKRAGHSSVYKLTSGSTLPDGRNQASGPSGTMLPTEPSVNRNEPSGPATRARDELFEAVGEVCGLFTPGGPSQQTLTKDERGRLNAAVKQLRDIGAEPSEIRKRAREYVRVYPNVKLTPQALTGNWSQLAPTTPVQRQEYCPDTFVPEPEATPEEREAGLAAIREIAHKLRNRDG